MFLIILKPLGFTEVISKDTHSTTLKCAFIFLMKLSMCRLLVGCEVCLKPYLAIKYCSVGFSMLFTSRKEAVRKMRIPGPSAYLVILLIKKWQP